MSEANGNGAAAVVAIATIACPVHDRLVLIDAAGHLVGRCDMCVQEAEHGLQVLTEIARRKAQGDEA